MPKPLPLEYRKLQDKVERVARGYGLDLFTSCYEVLDYDEINMVAAYCGFPRRYPHWKWGMEYERLAKSYEYGMSKIYEMVINNDPCYAYLLESNAFIDQKLVMCHVSGHNDFFKNNFSFSPTNRKMIDEMANHASRIRRYMDWYGVDEVEGFIDKVLSIENLIDVHSLYTKSWKLIGSDTDDVKGMQDEEVQLLPTKKEYMEHYLNPESVVKEKKARAKEKAKKKKQFPLAPERDIMAFLMRHAPLSRWQRDVMDMLHSEAIYFVPQAMTKIMNEGWASYWHAKLMTEKVMDPDEMVDFADRHSGVVQMQEKQLNPYRLGIELFRDIEDRWNKGCFGSEWDTCDTIADRGTWDKKLGLGQEKIFQVRKIYSDVTFVDEFFTLEFCKRSGFFAYEYDRKKREYSVSSRDFTQVKQKILQGLTNLGQPIIRVEDANFENRTELLLSHEHDGVDLDMGYGKETLKNIYGIWTRPVHIQTTYEDRGVMLSYDGEQFKETQL